MTRIRRKQRQLYIMMPFFLLVLCLGSLNLLRWLKVRPTNVVAVTPPTVATPSSNPDHPQSALTPTPIQTIPTATPNPLPTPTAYVPPSYGDDDIIQLLGPPPGSTFAHEATVSFYWQWPLPLSEDQFFAVYVLTDEGERVVGMVQEPNVGQGYRLTVTMAEAGATAVPLQWQIRLQTTLTPQPLRISETRSLQFLSIDN